MRLQTSAAMQSRSAETATFKLIEALLGNRLHSLDVVIEALLLALDCKFLVQKNDPFLELLVLTRTLVLHTSRDQDEGAETFRLTFHTLAERLIVRGLQAATPEKNLHLLERVMHLGRRKPVSLPELTDVVIATLLRLSKEGVGPEHLEACLIILTGYCGKIEEFTTPAYSEFFRERAGFDVASFVEPVAFETNKRLKK